MSHYHDEGTEADYMHDCELAASGGEQDLPDPEFEVVSGRRNDRKFAGSRAACWDFKRRFGGYVRPWSGEDEHDEFFHA